MFAARSFAMFGVLTGDLLNMLYQFAGFTLAAGLFEYVDQRAQYFSSRFMLWTQ